MFEDTIRYADDTVGSFMTREWVAVPEGHTVEQAIGDLRARGELPPQTDRVFVVDARHVLVGAVPLQALLVQPPAAPRRRRDEPRHADLRAVRATPRVR